MPKGETERAIEARNKLLQQTGIDGPPSAEKPQSCVEKLMFAGKSRTEAEVLCEEHQTNVKESKRRDSFLGKIMSAMGKK